MSLVLKEITKKFGNIEALKGVSLNLKKRGDCRAFGSEWSRKVNLDENPNRLLQKVGRKRNPF